MGNILFGLELQGRPMGKARKDAQNSIDLVGLRGFADSYPHSCPAGCGSGWTLRGHWRSPGCC